MEFEDFVEPEIAVTAAVTAALFSPRTRKVLRKGLVYGMAGVLTAGDVIMSFARSVSKGMQQAGEEAAHAIQQTDNQAREEAKGVETREEEKGIETGEEAEIVAPARRKTATKVGGKPS